MLISESFHLFHLWLNYFFMFPFYPHLIASKTIFLHYDVSSSEQMLAMQTSFRLFSDVIFYFSFEKLLTDCLNVHFLSFHFDYSFLNSFLSVWIQIEHEESNISLWLRTNNASLVNVQNKELLIYFKFQKQSQ